MTDIMENREADERERNCDAIRYTKNGEEHTVYVDKELSIAEKIRPVEEILTDEMFMDFFTTPHSPEEYQNTGIMGEFYWVIRTAMNMRRVFRGRQDIDTEHMDDFAAWAAARTDGELVEYLFLTVRNDRFGPDFTLGEMGSDGRLGILLQTLAEKMKGKDTADMGAFSDERTGFHTTG